MQQNSSEELEGELGETVSIDITLMSNHAAALKFLAKEAGIDPSAFVQQLLSDAMLQASEKSRPTSGQPGDTIGYIEIVLGSIVLNDESVPQILVHQDIGTQILDLRTQIERLNGQLQGANVEDADGVAPLKAPLAQNDREVLRALIQDFTFNVASTSFVLSFISDLLDGKK